MWPPRPLDPARRRPRAGRGEDPADRATRSAPPPRGSAPRSWSWPKARTACSLHGLDRRTAARRAPTSRACERGLADAAPASAIVTTRERAQALAAQPINDDRDASDESQWVAVFADSLDDVQDNVSLIRRQVLLSGGIALVIAIFAGYLVARALAARVKRLERAARKVAAGDFSQPIKADSDDELGQLARRSTTCRTSSRGWTARASSSSRRRRTSCARRSSRSAGSSSCWPTRTSTRRRGARSWSRSAARSTACASWPSSCSTSRGWRRARWSCGSSRRTSASSRARSRRSSRPPPRSTGPTWSSTCAASRSSSTATPSAWPRCCGSCSTTRSRHTPPGTDVRVSAARADGHVRLEVADRGPGINRQNMPHIFEPFFTSAEQAQGAGLGLAIARELAERMQGRLTVRSGPGETTFSLVLPA